MHAAGCDIGLTALGMVTCLQESELEAAKWMSIAEYAAQPFLKGVPMFETLRERYAHTTHAMCAPAMQIYSL